MKTITALFHGEKGAGPNPGLTQKGREQVKSLLEAVPRDPAQHVECGTGARHGETTQLLGFNPADLTRQDAWGRADSLESKPDGHKVIVMADGTERPFDPGETLTQKPQVLVALRALPDGTFLAGAGREMMSSLGKPRPPNPACLVQLTIADDGDIADIRIIKVGTPA